MYDYVTGKSREGFTDAADRDRYYSYLIKVTTTNLYTLSKNNEGKVEEINLNLTPRVSESDMFLIEVAYRFANIVNAKLNLCIPLWQYIKWRFKNFKFNKNEVIKWTKYPKENSITSSVLTYIAMKNDIEISMFANIYKEYFK